VRSDNYLSGGRLTHRNTYLKMTAQVRIGGVKMAETNDKECDIGRVKTLSLTPAPNEMIKPGELIDIIGHGNLTLVDKRIYNMLIANAFGPTMARQGQEFRIETHILKGSHDSNDRIKDSVERLMRTIVRVRLPDGSTRRAALLGGNDLADDDRETGSFTYTFDRRMSDMLKNSTIFGKLELQIMKAFTSSYALSLYEAVAKRYRMKYKVDEEFNLEELRNLLGVVPGRLVTWSNLSEKAIRPALREVNALAPFGVSIEPSMKSGKKILGVKLSWWAKDVDQLREAHKEVQRPKVGRKARIGGTVETVSIKGIIADLPDLESVRELGRAAAVSEDDFGDSPKGKN